MKKRTALLLTAALVASSLTACGDKVEVTKSGSAAIVLDEEDPEVPLSSTAEDELEQETDGVNWKDYKSKKGWSVVYDANLIKVDDSGTEDDVQFVYTGEGEGINMVTANWIEGKMPDQRIEEIRETAEKDAEIDISGGYFPGTSDKWAYWITVVPMKKGSGPTRTYIIGQYQDGTLEFKCATTRVGDEDIDMEISDTLALIIDSLTFDDFGAQTMYENIPGTYKQEITDEMDGEEVTNEYYVTLNEDHTGVMSIQDDMKICWDDKVMISEDGEFQYFYTLDGDTLTIDFDGFDSIFYRQ